MIEFNCNNRGSLELCPLWWKNFIRDINPEGEINPSNVIGFLLEKYKIKTNLATRSNTFADLIVIFPSEEVYTEFLLIYG